MRMITHTTKIPASAKQLEVYLAARRLEKLESVIHPINELSCMLEERLSSSSEHKGRRSLEKRHEKIIHDFEVINRYQSGVLRILISGSSGLVGKELTSFLQAAGHDVHYLVRKPTGGPNTVVWRPESASYDAKDFEGFDAVFHLAGRSIASARWTKKIKKEIFTSRVRDTWLLSQIFLRVKNRPKTFICASATGYFGDRGDELLTESSLKGEGFLADVCEKWESAIASLEKENVRGVHTRFGIALSKKGGMLARLLPIFQLGLGTILGSGNQMISWVALDDLVYGLYHCLLRQEVSGPVNLVAPEPVSNRDFCQKLTRALHRPLFFRITGGVLRFIFGEMAEEMLLSSVKAYPEKLLKTSFQFYYPNLDKLLKQLFS